MSLKNDIFEDFYYFIIYLGGFIMQKTISKKKLFNVRNMVKMSVLSVLAFIIMIFNFPIAALFPTYLKVDFSDVFPMLGGFAMGPVAALVIQLLKNMLHLTRTQTGGVGELSNFIVGSALVVPAALVYYRKRTLKYAVIGSIVGIISMICIAFLSNYFLILGLWGLPKAGRMPALLGGILQFNAFKGTLVAIVTFILYKRVSPILHK
jgi:riboflavin transporter